MYDAFIADNAPGDFIVGVLGASAQSVPPQMRELVRRGAAALPELLKHLEDRRPTRLEVGNVGGNASSRRIGVDYFMFSYFSDEYDARAHAKGKLAISSTLERDFRGRYNVKVGDVCFVLVGQIVNRRLFAVRYQPSGGLVINSPIEAPDLARRARDDWGQADSEILRTSLLSDVHTHFTEETVDAALKRLRFYFPETYKTLKGHELKERRRFEREQRAQP